MESTRATQRNRSRVDGFARLAGIIIGVIGLLLMVLGLAITVDAVIQWYAPA